MLQAHTAIDATPGLAQAFRAQVESALAANPGPSCLNDKLTHAWEIVAPTAQPPPDRTDTQWPAQIRQMWQLRRSLKSLSTANVTAALLWKQWVQVIRLQKLQKAITKQARERKRHALRTFLQEIDQPGFGSLMSRVYKAAKRFAPKTRKIAVQLRDASGQLLDKDGTRRAYQTFFEELYQSPEAAPVPLSLTWGLNISWSEWHNALSATASRKAVPAHYSPAILWQITSDILADTLTAADLFSPGPVWFEPEWTEAHLALLPKPNKAPTSPGALRPISLLDPVSKAPGVILARRLQPYTEAYLASAPQFAYLAGRATGSAIGRIISHCQCVRNLLQSQSHTIHRLKEGHKSLQLAGGLALSVDLSRAFDTLPESVLLQALTAASVPCDLVTCIIELHRQVKFCLRDCQVEVLAGRGIRQGCPLAPQLWALASGHIIHLIEQCTSHALVREGLSLYADDHLCSWIIRSVADLRKGLREAACILDTLQACELDVSADKSVFLLEVRGSKANQILKDITCKLPSGKGIIAGRWKLPLRQSHPYLGIMLSYRRFEQESYQHRKDKAISTFARLAHVLKDRRALSDSMRIRLWQSLVWPVLSYGLTTSGLTAEILRDCTSLVAKQLRIITRSHSYYTRETNAEIFAKTSVSAPALIFASDITREISTVQAQGSLQPPRVLEWLQYTQTAVTSYLQLPSTPDKPRLVSVDCLQPTGHPCPECGVWRRHTKSALAQTGRSMLLRILLFSLRRECPNVSSANMNSGAGRNLTYMLLMLNVRGFANIVINMETSFFIPGQRLRTIFRSLKRQKSYMFFGISLGTGW